MGFKAINISEEINNRKMESADFREGWGKSRDEYRLIGEMISLRKQNKITQSQLADMIGNKQQVISRIEKKENSPLCCRRQRWDVWRLVWTKCCSISLQAAPRGSRMWQSIQPACWLVSGCSALGMLSKEKT